MAAMDRSQTRCGLWEIYHQLIHVGLRLLAMRALEIGELNQFQVLGRSTTIGAVRDPLQLGAKIGKRILTECNNLVSGDDVLPVSKGEELKNGLASPCRSCRQLKRPPW